MITYDELPQSAQKAYRTTNTVRKVAMFLCFPSAIVWAILCIINGENLFSGLVDGFFIGAGILGIVHGKFAFKGLLRRLKKMLGFGIVGLALAYLGFGMGFTLLVGVMAFAGFVLVFVDIALFILKKPLIYPFENKYFLNSRKAQEEIQEEMINKVWDELNSSNASGNAMETLKKLKEMLDNGVITEDEFNQKKAELLQVI